MKLSTYVCKLGISYRTAWRWFKAGHLAGYQADTGTLIVTEPKVAIYTRVATAENKNNLEAQAGAPD